MRSSALPKAHSSARSPVSKDKMILLLCASSPPPLNTKFDFVGSIGLCWSIFEKRSLMLFSVFPSLRMALSPTIPMCKGMSFFPRWLTISRWISRISSCGCNCPPISRLAASNSNLVPRVPFLVSALTLSIVILIGEPNKSSLSFPFALKYSTSMPSVSAMGLAISQSSVSAAPSLIFLKLSCESVPGLNRKAKW